MKLFFIPKLPEDKGFTLVEVIFTISILALVLVAMTPFIRTVYMAWNLGDRKTEMQQNGRVGLEMMSRCLRQAKRITGIPASGSGNFIRFRNTDDTQTIIFYHNIPTSIYYYNNITSLIRDNDLVMRNITTTTTTNALLARSLTNFKIDCKNSSGAVVTRPYDVSYMDITMNLSDPQGLIPDTINIFSSISLRPVVRINRPVWVGAGSYAVELSTDIWISGFNNPSSISINSSDGSVWVADTNNDCIKKYSSTGARLFTLPGFRRPASVSVNPNGECWVADTNNDCIKKYSSTGALVFTLTGFKKPASVSVNFQDGSVWVADTNNNRVKKLSSSGALSVNVAGFNRPGSVSADPTNGGCWVADTNNNRVKKLSLSGALSVNVAGFNRPGAVSADYATGECWVADTGNNQVVKLDAAGNEEFRISGFTNLASVASSP